MRELCTFQLGFQIEAACNRLNRHLPINRESHHHQFAAAGRISLSNLPIISAAAISQSRRRISTADRIQYRQSFTFDIAFQNYFNDTRVASHFFVFAHRPVSTPINATSFTYSTCAFDDRVVIMPIPSFIILLPISDAISSYFILRARLYIMRAAAETQQCHYIL